jgi:hypothetical protein
LQFQNGEANQLVVTLCDYRRPASRSQSDPNEAASDGGGVVGVIELRGFGATALPTAPAHLPLIQNGSAVGTIEVCVGRRRRDITQRAVETEW